MALELDKTDVFYAISHPLRRAILESLLEEDRPAMYLAGKYEITKAGLSQHLKVLETAGLVVQTKEGRYRYYSINQEPLYEIYEWTRLFEKFWTDKLENLGDYLRRKHGPPKSKKGRTKKKK